MSTTQDTARTVIDRETDARFWSQTGYKSGQKLDMSIPTDRAMAQVWNTIHAKVVAEDNAGTLHLTYNHPVVQQGLATAAAADADTAAHLDAAASSADPAVAQHHVERAATAQAASQRATASVQQATQHAPPNPAVVRKAASDAAASAPPVNAGGRHHLGHHQAQRAPGAVADGNKPTGSPPVPPTFPPSELATARREAPQMAGALEGSPYIGYTRPAGAPHGELVALPSRDALVSWYNGHIADPTMAGVYVAAFDKTDSSWPGPLADGLGGEAAVIVTAHPPDAPPGADPWANTLPSAPPAAPAPEPEHRDAPPNVPTLTAQSATKLPSGKLTNVLAIGAALVGAGVLAYFLTRKSDDGGATARMSALPAPRGAGRGGAFKRLR